MMPRGSFGEGQGFAHIPAEALTQGVVPTLDMSGLTTFFTDTLVGLRREGFFIRFPKIAVRRAFLVGIGNFVP